MNKLTAVVKSAEEITGVKGLTQFTMEDGSTYDSSIASVAGKRIDIWPTAFSNIYEYRCGKYVLKKEWLRDFIEEPDWEDMERRVKAGEDVKVMVRTQDRQWTRRYFSYKSRYDGKYYCYESFGTKWSVNGVVRPWEECRLPQEDEI